MTQPLVMGAVLYDPKVSVIWDIIGQFFSANGCPMDVVFYTNYERQVEALLKGHIDIAWNSPLAWLDAQRQSGGTCRAIAMRDTDCNRVSHLITKRHGPIASVADLRGQVVAVGAQDSPQATLIPLGLLQRHSLVPGQDVQVRRFDLMVGKHGDHIGGELQAFQCLDRGEAAASALLDLNWQAWTQDGTIDPAAYTILATSEPYDHCCFTVRQDFPQASQDKFLHVLFSMSYDNPRHREMMDLEGLKAWVPGRISGYEVLHDAVQQQQFFARTAP